MHGGWVVGGGRGSYVIDDIGTELLDRHAGDIWSEGIYADDGIGHFSPNDAECAAQPFYLFLFRGWLTVRARATCSHVDHAAAFGHNLLCTAHDVALRLHTTPSIERVGRHVQDTHHLRLFQ